MGPLDNMCLNGDILTVVNATNLNLSRLNQIQMQESFIYLGLGQVATRIFRVDEAITGSQATTVDHATAITVNSTRLADQEARISANEATLAALSLGVADLRDDLDAGLAMANAMEVFLPDPGARFRLNVGMGTHGGMAAIGITGAGRINQKGDALYIGAAGSTRHSVRVRERPRREHGPRCWTSASTRSPVPRRTPRAIAFPWCTGTSAGIGALRLCRA